VQVGPPEAVWREPIDAWTATFLGFGPVVRAEARDGLVFTPWGALESRRAAGTGAVDAVVRPDGARLDASGPIDATIVRSTFTGTRIELLAAAGAGPPLTVVVAPRAAPAVGDRVRLSIDPDALLVYPVGAPRPAD
jgi:ABC-type Fe3+/spermidine/putrescine transport system ATPase subunit